MKVAREETSGRGAALPLQDEEDAVASLTIRNSVSPPNFYSRNNRRVWRVAEQVEYGIIGINPTSRPRWRPSAA